jgi:hypothetical protein
MALGMPDGIEADGQAFRVLCSCASAFTHWRRLIKACKFVCDISGDTVNTAKPWRAER